MNYNITEKEVNLEVTLGIERSSNGLSFYIELRIGEEKLYVIKNMKDFIRDVKTHKTIEFGKNFTFKPYIHIFSPTDRAIIDLTLNHYDYEAKAGENVTRRDPGPLRLSDQGDGSPGRLFKQKGQSLLLIAPVDSPPKHI